jgi:hypothetical protein
MFANFRERVEYVPTPGEPLKDTDYGKAMHKLLEDYYGGKSFVSSGDRRVDARFHEYVRFYGDENLPIVGLEQKLCRPLTDRINLIGTSDMVLTDAIWDHKTSGRMSDKDKATYDMSDQLTHYLWCVGRTEGKVLVNQISSADNPANKFIRMEFYRSAHDVTEFEQRMMHIGNQIIKSIEENTAWLEKNPGSCGDFKGCYYKTLCKQQLYDWEGKTFTNDHFSIKFKEEI